MKLVALMARHGETEENAKGVFRSWSDPPLDSKGIRQANEAGRILKRYKVHLIVASPLQRSQKTAQIASQYVKAPVEQDSRLRGWNVGILTGKKRTQATETVRDWYVSHPDKVIPKGESINQGEERFSGVLNEALAYGESGKLPLLETHGSGMKFAQSILTGKRDSKGDSALVEPGGIAAVYKQRDGFIIKPIFRASKSEGVPS